MLHNTHKATTTSWLLTKGDNTMKRPRDIREYANRKYKQYAITEAKREDAKSISYDKINHDMLFNGFDINEGKPFVRYRLYERDYIVEITANDWAMVKDF